MKMEGWRKREIELGLIVYAMFHSEDILSHLKLPLELTNVFGPEF